MAKKAGHKAQIKVSGTALTLTGEATTATGNVKYQITDSSKQVLPPTATIVVHLQDSIGETAEVGTTTTNIKITAHGLSTGDFIYNTTRSEGSTITVVDVDNLTSSAITSQTDGDSIDLYTTEDSDDYTLNRLSGYITYTVSTSRVIRISGTYLPLTAMGEAFEYTYTLNGNNEECTTFGDSFIERKQLLKDVGASLSQYYADSTYQAKLVDGSPIVLEFYVDSTGTFDMKGWFLFSTDEVNPAVDNIVGESLEFESTLDADSRCITFD